MIECPKCHYVRLHIDAHINAGICPSCGIVYEKWLARQQAANSSPDDVNDDVVDADDEQRQTFREFILYVPDNIATETFWARVITLFGFAIWGYYFISSNMDWETIGNSFLHNINLAFHEFGHVFFRPFGLFMTILGGSLFQCLLPLVPLCAFVFKQRDNFAGSIMLWWCGQNFIDIAPYIDDAEYRTLPLVGGGSEESHDWGNLLTMTNLVSHAHSFARTSFYIGSAIMIVALIWGGLLLLEQRKHLSKL